MKTAYPQTQGTCSIRLYSNIPFDNTYEHHSLISRKFTYNNSTFYTPNTSGDVAYGVPKERFINRLKNATTPYYPKYDLTGEFNFDFSNGLVASVVLELTPAQTNANYLRLTCGDDVYYYFITSINQVNYDTYKLSLELDVLMTYQDEFLEGMKDVPVFTQRKHCHRYTNDGLMPHSSDFKSGDDAFLGVKPSLVKDIHKLHFDESSINDIEDIKWLYICVDTLPDITGHDDVNELFKSITMYKNKNKAYPLVMMCVPINVSSVTYYYRSYVHDPISVVAHDVTFSRDDIIKGIRKLVNDGKIHGAKVSPYPPFTSTYSIQRVGDGIRILPNTTEYHLLLDNTGNKGTIVTQNYGETKVMMGNINSGESVYSNLGLHGQLMFSHGFMIIEEQNACNYIYEDITDDLGFSNTNRPTIDSQRYLEPKLLFSPFKKYKISAQYCNEGSEFYPELLFSEKATSSLLDEYFSFETIATSYIGDNNFYTKVRSEDEDVHIFDNYKYEKIGLASSVNYIFPCGTDALDVFNSTQAQSFYTSKVASGITSGISVAGGIGSIILGAGMTAGSGGTLTPMGAGLVAGGVTAIAGGVTGVATTIKSANAKIEDLKNTPDSVNVSGSNFITDECITEDTNGLPYVVVYDVTNVIKENANDFFYNYGYQVARECYFNTELSYDNNVDGKVDNQLFGRTIFNYIQLREEITNKINYDMPIIVKQKLSSIFNNGITLWSFFENPVMWSMLNTPTESTNPDKWFMKCELDNTEYSIVKYHA